MLYIKEENIFGKLIENCSARDPTGPFRELGECDKQYTETLVWWNNRIIHVVEQTQGN